MIPPLQSEKKECNFQMNNKINEQQIHHQQQQNYIRIWGGGRGRGRGEEEEERHREEMISHPFPVPVYLLQLQSLESQLKFDA